MNWMTGLQKAIDYVEETVTEEIDYEEAAKRAYSSSFHFQKVFALVCGLTLGEYVRCRRLSLAAEELAKDKGKVIDVALKYGYDTPESFSRAFTRFHGVTPMQAKNGATTKFYSRLSVKLTLQGGETMDYRIEKLGKIQVICKRKKFAKHAELTTQLISEFWAENLRTGIIPQLCSYIPQEPKLKGLLGISFTAEFENETFPYGIGAEYAGGEVAKGLEVIEIPAHTYAVFPVKGEMPDAFAQTYKKICTEFFPQSGYEYGFGVEFEVYPSADTQSPDYYCEIWVAVKDR